MTGLLPKKLTVGGVEYAIRPNVKNILRIFEAFSDPELETVEKWIIAIFRFFKPFRCADDIFDAIDSGFDFEDAQRKISWFISAGRPEKKILEKPVYDWQKDEQMIFSAVNKISGREVREEIKKIHWWTFLGWFNEIGEGNFTFIVGIRDKLNHSKKLEKYEKEFLAKNKELVKLEPPKTKEQLRQEEEFNALLEEVLG